MAIDTVEGELRGRVPKAAIPEATGFAAWCESIEGLEVDGKPFTLSDRPAMREIYGLIPTTREEAARRTVILMKCAQVGFTVMEVLAAIYMALKFEVRLGFFLPSMALAQTKSRERFMPIMRLVPHAHAALTAPDPQALRPVRSEGNILLRRMGRSVFHFLWTSGRSTTESNPMDVVCFDEVQEMAVSAIEKVFERMSASKVKFALLGSTANNWGGDIHFFYERGNQLRFHTRCPECGVEEPLDAYFPACIGFDPDFVDPETDAAGQWRYRCRTGHWIADAQQGAWKPDNPDADPRTISIHFHQMLSPTISPAEVYFAYLNAHDIKNFYNRKLGKPYQDPSELPVTDAILAACVAEGAKAGVFWKNAAANTFMGIDQMGGFNCVVIKERLPDGRHAVIHAEEIYGNDPFDRCGKLIAQYGVQVCVVEQLPNINDARRFAQAHEGRVFLATRYCEVDEGIARWGDASPLSRSEHRTNDEDRDRHTVHIDQHKAMAQTLHRIALTACLFPDPKARVQEVREKAARFQAPILDRVFPHLTRTALVTERVNELERRYRRKVEKRGKDPHHSFAFMLCEVAMSRAYGTATFIFPDLQDPHPTEAEQHPVAVLVRHQQNPGTCGGCQQFEIKLGEAGEHGQGVCRFRSTATQQVGVRDRDGAYDCPGFAAIA
jgi:hypothetical protein